MQADTVRRTPGPWTPSVHALLRHLEAVGFDGAPRARGFDGTGLRRARAGDPVVPARRDGRRRPAVAGLDPQRRCAAPGRVWWLRDLHAAVAGFVPSTGARWREGGVWRPGLIVGHNDAAPYNAAWADGRLAGFFDWDFAAPVTPEWDLRPGEPRRSRDADVHRPVP
ncbi:MULTISPECIES: hypothetical protein [unclassified Micromonospora]|uniref:hypothetical protein n=1 Tax=unclassified Micromonospora TaxID=2617518 RepID=UPI00363ED0D0